MQLLRATIDRDLAMEKVSELLALENDPERLGEKLNLPRDIEKIKTGIAVASFTKLISEVTRLKEFVKLEKEIANVQSGKWAFSFLGKATRERKLAGLMDDRRKFGSLIETPRWFYRQDRVWLLNAIRDYAMDMSHQGDAEWSDETAEDLPLPVLRMFETGDVDCAKNMAAQLSLPFKEMDPKFIMTRLEGHRALYYDLDKRSVYYFMPTKDS